MSPLVPTIGNVLGRMEYCHTVAISIATKTSMWHSLSKPYVALPRTFSWAWNGMGNHSSRLEKSVGHRHRISKGFITDKPEWGINMISRGPSKSLIFFFLGFSLGLHHVSIRLDLEALFQFSHLILTFKVEICRFAALSIYLPNAWLAWNFTSSLPCREQKAVCIQTPALSSGCLFLNKHIIPLLIN